MQKIWESNLPEQKMRNLQRQKNRKGGWHIQKLEHATTLGQRIRFHREAQNKTEEDVAHPAGISVGQLSRIENDLVPRPQPGTVEAIRKVLGPRVEQLTLAQSSLRPSDPLDVIASQKRSPAPANLDASSSDPQFVTFKHRINAYDYLSDVVAQRGAKKIDLLQFSGHTALPVFKAISKGCPDAAVRLLLCHPDVASRFDSDHMPDHRARLITTIDAIHLMEAEKKIRNKTKIYYYQTVPSISSVIVDDDLFSLSWYYSFQVPKTKIALNRSAVGELVATPLRYSLRQVLPPCFLSFFTRCFW
jgi:transcriptional regulator with XRE-family HTH domain